jgi:hypothetical protein
MPGVEQAPRQMRQFFEGEAGGIDPSYQARLVLDQGISRTL